jgi:hypothetical protein
MSPALSPASRTARRARTRLVDRLAPFSRPQAFDFTIRRMEHYGNPGHPIPERLVLLRPDPRDSSRDHLFLDHLPLPRDAWRYDAHDRVLSWRGAFGGGHLHLTHDGRGGTGNVGGALRTVSVQLAATAVFNCDVAPDCGATYVSSGGSDTGLAWDPTLPAWTGAAWTQDRLQLSYTVTPGGPFSPPVFTFDFQDDQTGSVPWDPQPGNFQASLQLGESAQGRMVWNLGFKSLTAPDPDQGTPPMGPDTVYPYWMQAQEDAAAASINGVLEIDGVAPNGTLLGMRGVRATPAATGWFRTAPAAAPFGVFAGRLVLGGGPVAGSRLRGDTLSWSGLDPAHQARTGLPACGSLRFYPDGSGAAGGEGTPRALRLGATSAMAALELHADLHPQAAGDVARLRRTLDDPSLDMYGLMAMTPYAQDPQGGWGDVVQAAVTQDLSDIMNSFIPGDMWNLVFPQTPQPTLSGELAEVAASPVPNPDPTAPDLDPAAFYSSLATAVVTEGLAGGSDDNCKRLNGPRAQAWLKTQVAASPVYHAHGQLLFQYEWQQRFPLSSQYAADQVNNASTYLPQIQAQLQATIDDINTNVAQDVNNPDLRTNLIAQVTSAGQFATESNLYWAFAYFTYNTAPAILANIALQMGISTGSSDGTTLSRLFQQNVTVLTALDPSGFFARQYTSTLNVFLSTNVLPSMFGFTGQAESFDIVKLYLQQWVTNNLANEDTQIAAAAAQIQSIIDGDDADEMLKASIEALNSFSGAIQDTLALPYVANSFVKWFSTSYPKLSGAATLFGSVLIGGITALAVMNLVRSFKDWDNLDDEEKAQIITDATQLGLQIVAAVVKRGVRIYAIYGVEGMTVGQRAASVSKILLSGEAEALDDGLMKIGSSTARWLGDTAGSVGKVAAEGEAAALLAGDAAASAEEATFIGKVLGRNLDEFIATRVGPVFILAGMGFSIYTIAKGEGGVELAGDILNLVSGSLMLFALVGEWAVAGAVEGTVLASLAPVVAVAGPLAILAALAGVGLMIYEMFRKPPDPVAEYVDSYAAPAGLAVRSQGSALDYAMPFANPDQGGLMMMGFTLSAGGTALACNPDGTVGTGPATALPSCVWQVVTDGQGMSQILTVAQPDPTRAPVTLLLSLMSDDTVSFQPKLVPPPPPASPSAPAAPSAPPAASVATQTWLSNTTSDAQLTSDGHMVSLDLTLQPVLPDSTGTYAPGQASGWLAATGTGLGYTASGPAGTFTLGMSGMAPNFMAMRDMTFILGSTPSSQQAYGPTFGVDPSTGGSPPATYALTGTLPTFLAFTGDNGTFAPNGQTASAAWQTSNTLTATNALGSLSASFSVTVAPPPAPPPPPSGADRVPDVRAADDDPPTYPQLQQQLVQDLVGAASVLHVADDGMMPSLVALLDALPAYADPTWLATHRGVLANLLETSLPNDPVAPQPSESSGDDEDSYQYTGPYSGYQDAFFGGVGAEPAAATVSGLVQSTISQGTPWWGTFGLAVLTDAARLSPGLSVDTGHLSSDMASYQATLLSALSATVLGVYQAGFAPTATALGTITTAAGQAPAALAQLTAALTSQQFTANVNQSLAMGGNSTSAATWFLYNLWITLKALGAPDVDGVIGQAQAAGLQVPAEVGPGSWWTGGYGSWFLPITGTDVTPQAGPTLGADMPETGTSYNGQWGSSVPFYPPAVGNGYASSLCFWGGLSVYNPPSDSCFGRGTGVLMADGSVRRVEDVRVGDEVRSTLGPRRVVLVEAPLRAGRTLYRVNGLDVFATAGHPFRTVANTGPARVAVDPWALVDLAPTTAGGGVGPLAPGVALAGADLAGPREVVVHEVTPVPDRYADDGERVYDLVLESWERGHASCYVGGPALFVAADPETSDPLYDIPTTLAIVAAMEVAVESCRAHVADPARALSARVAGLSVRDAAGEALRTVSAPQGRPRLPAIPGPAFYMRDGAWDAHASLLEAHLVRHHARRLRREIATGWRTPTGVAKAGNHLALCVHEVELVGAGVPAGAAVQVELRLHGAGTDERVRTVDLGTAEAPRWHLVADRMVDFGPEGLCAGSPFIVGALRVDGRVVGQFRVAAGQETVRGGAQEPFLVAPDGTVIGRVGVEQRRVSAEDLARERELAAGWNRRRVTAMAIEVGRSLGRQLVARVNAGRVPAGGDTGSGGRAETFPLPPLVPRDREPADSARATERAPRTRRERSPWMQFLHFLRSLYVSQIR